MVVLQDRDVPPGKGQGPLFHIDNEPVRRFVGVAGLLLPIILLVAVVLRPTTGLDTFLNSLSAYYYTSAIMVLEGILLVLGVFLLTYKGYPKNKYQLADRVAAGVAGWAAFFIALFPTYPPKGAMAPSWWTETAGKIHDWSSAVMFVMFAVFALWLFRKTDQQVMTRDKKWRNHVYLVCGVLIVGSIVWVVYLEKTVKPPDSSPNIFIPESVAIISFAASWLVKGGVLRRWMPDQR